MRKISEKPLLTLIETGDVNDMPVPAPATTVVVPLDWSGDNENGYIGKINGVPLYQVEVVACQSRNKGKYFYFPNRLFPPDYCFLCCLGDANARSPKTIDDAKAQCATDYNNGGSTTLREILADALATARAAGYRVSKPRKQKNSKSKSKTRVGPTCVCTFADGIVTRMTVFTALEKLDWNRGARLSIAAWESRWQMHKRAQVGRLVTLWAPTPPAIVAMHFEEVNGIVLGRRPDNEGVS